MLCLTRVVDDGIYEVFDTDTNELKQTININGVAGAGSEFKLVPLSDLELRLAELTEYSGTSMNEAGLNWFFSARDMICTHSGYNTEYLTIYGVAINYISRCTITDDELIVPCQSFDIHFKLKDKKQVVLLLTKCNLQDKKIEPVAYRHETLADGTLVITRNNDVVLKNNYTKELR